MARVHPPGSLDHAVSAIVAVLVAGIAHFPLRAAGASGAEYWVSQVLLFVAGLVLTEMAYAWLRKGGHDPEVPKAVGAFDAALRDASHNFCAVSSKTLGLWKSPTFIYYLTQNGVKSIIAYAKDHQGVGFTSDRAHVDAFYKEGFAVAAEIARGHSPQAFFGLRLLVYPAETYAAYRDEIQTLIRLHALARINCIPLDRDKLLQSVPAAQLVQLGAFSKALGQRVREEYTDPSTLVRIVNLLKRGSRAGPYRVSVPDFLMVNFNPGHPDVQPDDADAPQVWWYRKGTPESSKKRASVSQAEECLAVLCSVAETAKWDGYSPELITSVPVGKPAAREDFFTLEFFERWLKEAVPRHPELTQWMEEETELLRALARRVPGGRALDVGCGWGRHVDVLVEAGLGHVAGVDPNAAMVRRFQERYRAHQDKVQVRLEDGRETSFPDACFDLVVCMTNTFGNLGDDEARRRLAAEAVRVLRPGGALVVSVYRHTPQTLLLRQRSYRQVGLVPYPMVDKHTIRTREGLTSRQFTEADLRELLAPRFAHVEVEPLGDCALVATARKKA